MLSLSLVLGRVSPAAGGGADGGPPAVVAVGAVPVVVPVAELDIHAFETAKWLVKRILLYSRTSVSNPNPAPSFK